MTTCGRGWICKLITSSQATVNENEMRFIIAKCNAEEGKKRCFAMRRYFCIFLFLFTFLFIYFYWFWVTIVSLKLYSMLHIKRVSHEEATAPNMEWKLNVIFIPLSVCLSVFVAAIKSCFFLMQRKSVISHIYVLHMYI